MTCGRRRWPTPRWCWTGWRRPTLGAHDLRIPREETDAWLRTLTSVRLAVATRLGITDAVSAEQLAELPEDDPRSFLVSVYDWLGFAQETMVNAL